MLLLTAVQHHAEKIDQYEERMKEQDEKIENMEKNEREQNEMIGKLKKENDDMSMKFKNQAEDVKKIDNENKQLQQNLLIHKNSMTREKLAMDGQIKKLEDEYAKCKENEKCITNLHESLQIHGKDLTNLKKFAEKMTKLKEFLSHRRFRWNLFHQTLIEKDYAQDEEVNKWRHFTEEVEADDKDGDCQYLQNFKKVVTEYKKSVYSEQYSTRLYKNGERN